MSVDEPIPPIMQSLITTVTNNHESMGGEQRGALAEIKVRSILATDRATNVYEKAGVELRNATLGLKKATWVLAGATLILGIITALVK